VLGRGRRKVAADAVRHLSAGRTVATRAAVLLLCAMLVVTAMREFWQVRRFAAVWVLGTALCAWLMAEASA